MAWRLPKSLVMAAAKSPVGSPLPPGQRFWKKERWRARGREANLGAVCVKKHSILSLSISEIRNVINTHTNINFNAITLKKSDIDI